MKLHNSGNNAFTRVIAVVMVFALVFPSYVSEIAADAIVISRFSSEALGILPAPVRGIDYQARAMAYRELFERQLAPTYGGKAAWDTLLEHLSSKIGFNTAPSLRFSIEEIWARFIKANRVLVDEGNILLQEKSREGMALTPEEVEKLKRLSARFVFPGELELYIKSRAEGLEGRVITRSSGRSEDSYLRNLAGIFISPKRKNEKLIVQGIKDIFADAVKRIWIEQNSGEAFIDGIPRQLTSGDGFGILVQPFLDFDSSGTAMTELYGHTSVQAVIGDADKAVLPVYATTCQFLFNKNSPRGQDLEYNPSFSHLPYEFRLKGKLYSAKDSPEEMEEVMSSYPKISGVFSPLTEEEARELYRVACALESEIGVPLDIEWGFLDGKLYIVQMRPIIGDFKKPLVEIDKSLENMELVARTPIAIGSTDPKGFTGKVVVIGDNVSSEEVGEFEKFFGKEYIRVQYDAATKVSDTPTKAKVLVDPVQGSREAHNINLIYGRISDGEFVYANGPVLREDLDRELTFIPHPEMKGIWISQEDVTYFCDGLRAGFFTEKDAPAPEISLNERQKTLMEFNSRVRGMWFEKYYSRFWPEDHTIFKSGILSDIVFKGSTRGQMSIAQVLWHSASDDYAEEVRKYILMGRASEEDLDNIGPFVELLDEILSYPLYPREWESEWMEEYQRVLELKGINSAMLEEKTTEIKKALPKKYRAYFADMKYPRRFLAKNLEEALPEAEIRRSENLDPGTIRYELSKVDYDVSFFYTHETGWNRRDLVDIITRIKEKNPDAEIFLDSVIGGGADLSVLEKKYGKIYRDVTHRDDVLEKVITEGFLKWKDAARVQVEKDAAKEEKRAPEKQIVEPERVLAESGFSGKLKILVFDDSKLYLMSFVKYSQRILPRDEYEILSAISNDATISLLESGEFDMVIADLQFHGGMDDEIICLLDRVPFVVVFSGDEYETRRVVKRDFPESLAERTVIVQKEIVKNSANEMALIARGMREKLLRSNEETVIEQAAATGSIISSSKLRIFLVEDDHDYAGILEDDISVGLGQDQYEFMHLSVSQLFSRIELGLGDVVIFDMGGRKDVPGTVRKILDRRAAVICHTSYSREEVEDTLGKELFADVKYVDKVRSRNTIVPVLRSIMEEKMKQSEYKGRPEYPKPMRALIVYEDGYYEGTEDSPAHEKDFRSEISKHFSLEQIVPGELFAGEDIEIEYFKAGSYDEIWDRIRKGDIDIVVNETISELDVNKGYFKWVYSCARDANDIPPRIFNKVLAGSVSISGFMEKVIKRRETELKLYQEDLARWESKNLLREPEKPGKFTVLCLQDEPDVVSGEWWHDTLRSELDPDEYIVLGAENVAEAREKFAHMKVDMCFADIMGTSAAEHAEELYALFRGEDYGIVLSSRVTINRIPRSRGVDLDIRTALLNAGFDAEGIHITSMLPL